MLEQPQALSDSVMEAANITKIYPGTVALSDVSFKVYAGKVNILIGENGAGKSTLMRLLAGIEQPTGGEIYLSGEKVKILSPRDAAQKGIGMIHQELNLFPELSVMQNLFMGQEATRFGGLMLDKKRSRQITAKILKRLETALDPRARVGDLRMGQQQVLEIAKTMVAEGLKVLIMDEPTSSLSQAEVKVLFGLIRDLKQHGIAIVYISHRMEEIMQIGDVVSVLRDGRKVAEANIKDIDIHWMVSNMVGKERKMEGVVKPETETGGELLRCENITLPSESGGYILKDVSFKLRKGEILGIYGLLGAGRTELLETLMGMRPEYAGDIVFEGNRIKARSISEQIKRGMFLIPEDRKETGLIHVLSVGKNLTVSSMRRFTKYGCLQKKKEDGAAKGMIGELFIKVANQKLPIFSLSGGNQQKVVIGKAMLTGPKVLLMDEPSRGIDVGAKEEVFKLIFEFAAKGYGVIVVASELGEILRVSDKILVLSGGNAVGYFDKSEADENTLVTASETAIKMGRHVHVN